MRWNLYIMTISEDNTRKLITLPKKLKEDLIKIADKENRNLNNLIVKILQDYVKVNLKNKEG